MNVNVTDKLKLIFYLMFCIVWNGFVGIIVSIKTRAEEREAKLNEEKDEVMERCNQLELAVEVQKVILSFYRTI